MGEMNQKDLIRYLESRSKASDEDYNSFVEKLSEYLFVDNPYLNKDHDKSAKVITFQVTESCNLKCSYCYQINKSKQKLSFNTAKKFIELLLTDDTSKNNYLNKYNTGSVIIDFIGGEPLLEIDLIEQIMKYFIKRCIELDHPWAYNHMISIGSNGTLYFTDKVQKFINKYQDRLSMSITVDGNKRLHDSCRIFEDGSGSYEVASKAAIDWMKRTNSKGTKLTIAPENVMYLKDAIINMINLGFEYINENCVYEDVWDTEHAKILYDQLVEIGDYLLDNDLEDKIGLRIFDPGIYSPMDPEDNNNWCGGDGRMISVDVRGAIFNCIRYMQSSLGGSRTPLRIGDVDSGIGCIDADKCNICSMQCITRRSQSVDKCFYCPIAKGCGWCSAYNYQTFGTVNKRAITICETHTAEALANNYYWNKYLKKHGNENRLKLYVPCEWAIKIIGEDEYNKILKLSKCDKLLEKEWYDNIKKK